MRFSTCPTCDQVFVIVVDKEKPVSCCDNETIALQSKRKKSENHDDEHTPIVRKTGNFVTIRVNEKHPMIKTHHISMMLVETNKGFQFKNIRPKDEPKADFILANGETIKNVYVYCNVHLLWSLH